MKKSYIHKNIAFAIFCVLFIPTQPKTSHKPLMETFLLNLVRQNSVDQAWTDLVTIFYHFEVIPFLLSGAVITTLS